MTLNGHPVNSTFLDSVLIPTIIVFIESIAEFVYKSKISFSFSFKLRKLFMHYVEDMMNDSIYCICLRICLIVTGSCLSTEVITCCLCDSSLLPTMIYCTKNI